MKHNGQWLVLPFVEGKWVKVVAGPNAATFSDENGVVEADVRIVTALVEAAKIFGEIKLAGVLTSREFYVIRLYDGAQFGVKQLSKLNSLLRDIWFAVPGSVNRLAAVPFFLTTDADSVRVDSHALLFARKGFGGATYRSVVDPNTVFCYEKLNVPTPNITPDRT